MGTTGRKKSGIKVKKIKDKTFNRDIVIKEKDDTSQGFCESCLYWDERTNWCFEYESYGNADRIWTCARWVDRHAYEG